MSCFGSSRAHRDHHDYLDRAARLLQACQEGLQQFQIPGAPLLFNTVLSLVKKVQATKANGKAIEDLSEELCRLSEVLKITMDKVQADLPNRTDDPESRPRIARVFQESLLQQRVAALGKELESLDRLACDLRRGRFLCRCLRAKRDLRVLEELSKRVQQALDDFKLAGQITIEALVNEIARQINAEIELQRLERENRTLEQLPHVVASFQASSQRAKSHYLNGTFPRVLEELDVWAKGNSEPAFERLRKPIWVLSESQGSGKSTLASELCRRLRSDATKSPLGASFFFDLAVEGLSTTRDFFSTISYQLAQSQPVLRPLIVAAANKYLSSGGDLQMEFTAKTLLLEPLRALARSQQQQLARPIVIVVDGVDECADLATDALPEMLRHLIACAQEPSSPIRILLTTRPNATVDGILDAPELRGIIHRHHLHDRAEAMGSDITTYLRERLRKLEAIQRSPTSINKLASHVDPSFAYAQALADFILAHHDHVKIALSPGSAGPSASLCALYSAITAHTSRLDAHQWRRMRVRVERPSILNLCGTSTCYGGITRWLRSQQTKSPASSILSQPLPVGLCAHCRTMVANAPLEAWVLKRIVATLVANGLDAAIILPPTPPEGHGQEDPWHPEPPATSHSRSTNPLAEPRIDRAEAIQLPSPEAPEYLAAGPVTTEPLAPANVERVLSARATRPEEPAGGAPLPEAATVSMPVAQPLVESFVGGFVAQIQASMAAVSPPAVVAPQAAPLPPDAPQLPHSDATPIPTPTAPTTSRPRPPKLRIAISDPPPHTTSPIHLPSPFRVHAHKTPAEHRVHSPTTFRSVSPSTPRGSPRRCSPRARRGSVLLQRLGTPIPQRAASPWDVRRTPNRAAGSPVRARAGARRDLRQDSPASRRDSPRSPLAATSPDMRRNTA